jgi:hypothetical protein
MEVTQYTYQSPYSSPVQLGRASPNTQKEEQGAQTDELISQTNESLKEAQKFEASQTQEVKPTINASKLDLYV